MAIRASEQIIHKAAWLYYTHGLRQDEVARQLNISRASVAMYLRKARDTGIVNISTSTQLFTEDVLARQLEDAFGLAAVWVVPQERHALDPTSEVPAVAASVFLELVSRGNRIGVAWGRTVYAMADVMSFADLQDVTVVQLCGNLGAPYSYRPDQCTMEIARRLNAKGLNFYAPLVLTSERLAQDLRDEPVIREQLASIADCDLALFSVGTVDEDSHIVKCGALSPAEVYALRDAGAAGVIAGQMIDAKGELLDCSYNRRVISTDLASIRSIPKRMVVVQEDSKLNPLLAALAGGLCSHLVVTASMAKRLLEPKASPQALSHIGQQIREPRFAPTNDNSNSDDVDDRMKNLWNDAEAEAMVAAYAAKGVERDLALRVYTTRLLGGEPRLVLHGGGNTSSKTRVTDLVGEKWDVLCVKGSGWDMAVIEPQGLPAVKLAPLLKARALDTLSDEDMVALQRANLIDPSSPNPSVETLLHAFLPHKFVDHTHSTAILAIVDQGEDSEALSKKVFGAKLGFVPYIKPGFDLAKAAADIYDADPSVEGLILDKHGIFTFGDDAKQAYDRMIHYVTVAEDYVARHGKNPLTPVKLTATPVVPGDIAPMLRGAVAVAKGEGRFDRMVSDFRSSDAILEFVNSTALADFAASGVSTPDLSIRIKTGPMVLPAPDGARLGGYRAAIQKAVAAYAAEYNTYFEVNDALDDVKRTMLDPMPRLSLVPGLGMFGHGRTLKDAKIASDVGEMWMEAVRGAAAIGTFRPLAKSDLFPLEYWSLEQAKLAANKPKPLTGQIMLVTGGAGAIGAATAKLFAREGAHVVVVDLDAAKAAEVARLAGNNSIGVGGDITKPADVRAAFDAAVAAYGGVDIVVSNAGAAWEGAIGDIDDALLRKSFELNFFAHQSVAQNAVRIFRQQGTGGVLLFNASKQAVNPGARFGAYGLPKAATLFLSRQYALEYGGEGIRSNAVNADRIRSGLLTDAMIASRSTARGLSEKDYMSGNLLGQEVTAEDVAQAFLHQALAERTTADVTTVDGGNIAAALR